MKYLINNLVINSDQIRQVRYMPEDVSIGENCACFIDLGNPQDTSECAWDIVLHGIEADLFWDAYSSDAYIVISPKRLQAA